MSFSVTGSERILVRRVLGRVPGRFLGSVLMKVLPAGDRRNRLILGAVLHWASVGRKSIPMSKLF